MSDFNRKAFNDILSQRGGGASSGAQNIIVEKDKIVRKEIAELYSILSSSGDSKIAIDLLSDHVAMMVSMINEFKKRV
ncbi:MAG: hypothetical protein JW982_10280 [Spirochaetes bacterium]|nr:hypothetical protein [Spirochaetota bacterium]